MHKKIIKIGIILALCVCALNVRSVYAQEVKVGTHLEHEYEISVIRRAGEHTDGERLYKCKICGESHVETIEATGHIWSEWIVDVNPTQTKEGHRYRVCTKYPEHPHYEEEIIPALGVKTIASEAVKTKSADPKKDNKTEKENKQKIKITESTQDKDSYNKKALQESKKAVSESKAFVDNGAASKNQPGIKAANITVNPVMALLTGINVLDVCAGVGALAVSWWYIYILKPMVSALMWIKRKRSEIEKKLYPNK